MKTKAKTRPAHRRPSRLPAAELAEALGTADLRVLLMVLVHLTGDLRWMEPPFRPKRDVDLIAAEHAGLSEDAAQQIRAEAFRLLSGPERSPRIHDPGNDLMVRMMSACLGEAVPPEYAPMIREELGFCDRQVAWGLPGRAHGKREQSPIVIVGAGASGIALGANLAKLEMPFVIIDENDEVGGTWHKNTYPGCGVDTPNHAYSFSFGRPYHWTRYFASGDEVQSYLVRSAEEADVRPHVVFRTRVTRAAWDETACRWRVNVTGPDGNDHELQAAFLVSAIGQLSLPSIPKIAGLEEFGGQIFHSSAWPPGLDIARKRLAIVGTGASSMQIVPAIADQVASLTIYQRTAQWARPIPRYHEAIGAGARWLLDAVPYYAAWFRFSMLWRYGDGLLPTLRKDPSWPHPERSVNRTNDRHRAEMTRHIVRALGDRTDLLPKCLPSYPPYGKRILLDNGWYSAITRPNVELVSDDVERLHPTGIEAGDGKLREADIVVLATGFDVSQMAARLNISGRHGLELADKWKNQNPTAYLGISVPGFPNFFCMQGPNTGLGHGGSAIFQAECQARYIAGCIVKMIESDTATIDVKQRAHDDYVRRVDAEHETMIWTHPGMSTYYRNKAGRVFSVMPWRLVDYWAMTHDPCFADYDLTFHAEE